MSQVPSSLSVAIVERLPFVRVAGRANVAVSVHFKTLLHELRQRGFDRFILDLGECATMDSTFLGVLAGNAVKPGAEPTTQAQVCIQLLNPNPRVTELLENLGIAHLFPVLRGDNSTGLKFVPAAQPACNPTREEISKTSLEAHQLLMALNPENVAKFKDVAQFLAEDLKRLKSEGR